MRKNGLCRGPFIQIPPDSLESLIPLLSFRAHGKKKSVKKEANQRHFNDDFYCTDANISKREACVYRKNPGRIERNCAINIETSAINQNIEAKPICVHGIALFGACVGQ